MSVDPDGSPEVPPPPADPWPTDASISPAYPPPAPPQQAGPRDAPTPHPGQGHPGQPDPAQGHPGQPHPGQGHPAPTQPYPLAAQPYPGGGPSAGGPGWAATAGAEPVLAQIGEIAVTSTTVRTPSGEIPLSGAQWHVADYWQSEQKTPTWAIVVAIAGFCVLTVFSLLFLLVKETVHRGTVQVTVTNGNRQYVARIPVGNEPQVRQIHQQVNYVRSLAAI
jgi:hypothetical protein